MKQLFYRFNPRFTPLIFKGSARDSLRGGCVCLSLLRDEAGAAANKGSDGVLDWVKASVILVPRRYDF